MAHDGQFLHSLKGRSKTVVHFATPTDDVAWFVPSHIATRDAINFSETGKSYDRLGCFPLGMDVSIEDFEEIVFSQRKLRELELLGITSSSELQEMSTMLMNFLIAQESFRAAQHALLIHEVMSDLARMLISPPDDGSQRVRIYLGLQSGFQRTTERQFWAIYDGQSSRAIVDIFISKNVDDVLETWLHTFLSFRGFTRHECLVAEFEFATWNESLDLRHAVPPRLIQDLGLLTPEDSLSLLQRFSLSEDAKRDPLLVEIKWYCLAKRAHPSLGLAIALFTFEEVYIEVTDRNPLFNDQTGQAATFAELFALGSRCKAYFGITPSQFGELLSAKYWSHYGIHQLPTFRETHHPLRSAYAEAQIDIDSSHTPTGIPTYKRFTFLGVFTIPALVDILLLTTTGHGLYLSGTNGKGCFFMTQQEQHGATVALMISLLLSGAIGTWITCGGTCYSASMAFSAMNYFVITRLLGGCTFALIIDLINFTTFTTNKSAYAGLIFFLYLVVLTTYLSLLAALANYQFTGSTFRKRAEGVAGLEKMSDPAVLKSGLQALLHDVLREQKKIFFWPRSKGLLVQRLATSLEATEFLMNWYSRTTGSPRPMIFTSSWNLQTKIGCTIIYFAVALLDKLISLIGGGDNVGLDNVEVSLTMPVDFGLAYYLIGAALLDYNAQSLHEAASNRIQEVIHTDHDTAHATRVKSDNRRTVYWKILASNLVWHIWGLTVTILLWIFDSTNRDTGTIIYLSYVPAYTGLLWYQYTKVFSGLHALKLLLIGAAAGLIVGFVLEHQFPKWVYSDIVGPGTATWTAAILSLWAGRIVGPNDDTPQASSSQNETFRACSGPGSDQSWSQAELRSLYEQLSDLSKKERLKVEPQSEFGRQVNMVLAYFRQTSLSELAKRAFPDTEALLNLSAKLFNDKVIIAELVSIDHFSELE
ncbi:hypothetical protein BDZ45DRAFT_696705 [Acephala macrosclerotiorum]|nr:hypothetical protein BDZ45DRAFT_696705 [Acephala macrosclerotiorum]